MKHSKLMKKIAILGLAVLPGFMVGSAFSTWILGDLIGTKKDVVPDTYIDDVRPNYELDANTYDVFVFPNWMYADYILSGINSGATIDTSYLNKFDATSSFNDKKSNYASLSTNISSSDASFFGAWTDTAESEKYSYKHYVVDTAITQDDFEKIGTPSSEAKDQHGYQLSFCGWSADVVKVDSYGFMNQGNYHYISALDPLSSIDETALSTNSKFSMDGSSFNSKAVFIYPIYSSGKDYSAASSNPQPVVRLHGDVASEVKFTNYTDYVFEEELYFSQDDTNGNYGSSYYYYNNLVVKDDSIYYLDFTPITFTGGYYGSYQPAGWPGGWYNYQSTSDSNYSLSVLSTSASNLTTDSNGDLHPSYDALFAGSNANKTANILGEGIYNILVYISYPSTTSVSGTCPSDFKDVTKSKRPLLVCQDPNLTSPTYAYRSEGGVQMNMYVKIEKIDDFRVVGRNVSFDYENGSPLYKYGNGTYTVNGSENPCVDFEINNIYLDGLKTAKMNSFTYDGKSYGYMSNIFTVASNAYVLDETERLKSVSVAEANLHSEDRLTKYPKSSFDFYASDELEGGTLKVFAVGGSATDFENIENAPIFKNHNLSQSKGYRKNLFRITEDSANFYNIYVRAYYTYKSDGSLQISNVGIALAPHESKMARVYIYDGALISKANLVRTTEGFIDHEDETMKKGLIGFIQVESGTSFSLDLAVTPGNYSDALLPTVKDYYNYDGGRKFYEHQTELEFKVGTVIKKNMVLFLKKPQA